MTNSSYRSGATSRIRLELDQRRAQALHAALTETLHAKLIEGDRREAAREVLEQLDRRVPGWLDTAALNGEAGYLAAAEAVLRTLVDAEDGRYARSSLSEPELLRALGDAKPLGATAMDVLERMRHEQLITRRRAPYGEERWWAAAPAGRQFLHRDTSARDDAWAVSDPLGLLDLIYADGRGGGDAFLPWLQAIGRLEDEDLAPFVADLHRDGIVEVPDDVERRRQWLSLSHAGRELAGRRWRETSPGRLSFDRPARPPLPYRRDLPIRLTREGRSHPTTSGYFCNPAAWLQRSSKTKLWSTLKRDGAVEWHCQNCSHVWLVYLQATTRDGRPAYRDPASAFYNHPAWRPEGFRWGR
jgi:hypothetical protein